uniref:toll-like receptor 8 n=1 Tax=Pristiophorus japonicus TaxID=55135 RepID=UPI00398F30D0
MTASFCLTAARWFPRNLPCAVTLKNASSFIEFDCSNRHLHKVPEGIPSNVTSLNLTENQIQNINNKSFSKLHNLSILSLKNNHLPQTGLEPDISDRGMSIAEGSFSPLIKLQELYLDGNHLCHIPKRLPSSLQLLSLNDSKILNITKEKLSNIETLHLSQNCYHHNTCNVSIHIEDGAFSSGKKLKVLTLGSNNLTSVPRNLPETLRFLCLRRNKIQIINQDDFSHLIDLEFLDLNGNCPRCYNAPYPCEPCPGDGSIHIHPYAFQHLKNLHTLQLSGNSLYKILSSWFQNITSLKVLQLRWNYLITEIATGDFLNHLPKVEELDLSYNYFNQRYPKHMNLSSNFSKLVSLKTLLFQCYVFKEIEAQHLKPLFSLRNLTLLNLSTNFISQSNLSMFRNFTSLQVLYLSENRITPQSDSRALKDIGSVTETNGVEDGYRGKDHAFVTSVQRECCSYGKTLDLSRNSIFFINPKQFEGFEEIRCLKLSSNAIAQAFNGTEFTNVPNLKYLDLSHNCIDPAYNNAFKELKQLEVLDLSYNSNYFVVGTVTHHLMFIENLKSLKVLNLKWNQIFTLTEPGLNSDSLEILEFQGNRLDILWDVADHGCRYIHLFKNLTNLTHLDIANNKLCDIPSIVYRNLPHKLSDLSLAYNHLGHFDFLNLQRFKNLQTLSLSGNKLKTFNGTLHNYVTSLKNLFLNHNQIATLPDNFLAGASHLKHLDLSHNRLKIVNQAVFQVGTPNYLEVLLLTGNPFQCTCELLPFIVWINSCDVNIPRLATDVSCAEPTQLHGKSIISLDQHLCAVNGLTASLYFISLLIVLGVMVTVVISQLFYWDVRYFYYFCIAKVKGHQYQSLTMQSNSYDAFIAYDTSDPAVTDWVVNELLANLEDKEERHFSLCLEERDWGLGMAVADNLSQSIQKSKKTVFVLTRSYAKKGTFKTAFYMAHQRLLDENEDVIVLILLEPVLQYSKYLRLRKRLCKSSVLDWPSNPHAEGFFWMCLRNAIATDSQARYNNMFTEAT